MQRMLKIVEVEDTKVIWINANGILKEEIEVLKRDDELVSPLRFQNIVLKILIGNGIINYSFITNNMYRNSSKNILI